MILDLWKITEKVAPGPASSAKQVQASVTFEKNKNKNTASTSYILIGTRYAAFLVEYRDKIRIILSTKVTTALDPSN
jgi:hypothetical protein